MEIFVLIILFVFGIIMIVMTPLGAGYDEDHHLFRVWQLSNLEMLPKEQTWQKSKFPNIFIELSYRKQPLVESVGFDYWSKYGRLKLYDYDYYYRSISTRSRYAPPLLLPQAMAMRYSVGRFNLPALSVYYLSRFAGLLSYIFLSWLAVRLIPFGKWLLAVLTVAPMAIYQASTLNTDTITNGIGFLFIGGTLYVANKHKIGLKEIGGLLILISMLFFSKPNIFPFVVLPILIIPPSKFSKRIFYLLLVMGSLFLFGVEYVGWNLISPYPSFKPAGNVNALEQLRHISLNPLALPRVILNDLRSSGIHYLTQWIGVYGYDYGNVPTVTYIFFIVAIFLALLLKDDHAPNRKTRLSLLFIFFICYMATLLSLYLTYTAVGEGFVYGIQGRYYIPIAPLLFLALYNISSKKKFQPQTISVGLTSLAAVLTYTGALILTYHVTCGSSYYNLGTCYQPFYKNYSPLLRSSPPIGSNTILIQEFVPVCDGMNEVRVRVNSNGNNVDGAVEFVINGVAENRTIAQSKTPNYKIANDEWYSISFPTERDSANKLYTINIQGTSQSNDGPQLAYSVRPEYPLGVLFENGKPLEDDIIFQYGCLTGLKKILNSP